jgi:hypothetical protein
MFAMTPIPARTVRAAFLAAGALALLAKGGGAAPPSPPPGTPPPAGIAPHPELLNNAASLLDNLLGDEKNLAKILIIKGHGDGDFGNLVKAIAHAAAEGDRQLRQLAQSTPGMDLKALGLPPGEVAARQAIGKTKERDLLFSTGTTFEFNLLLTQTQALSYGAHLAEVVAAQAPTPEAAQAFKSLAEVLDRLLRDVTRQLRRLPPP